MKNLVLFSLMTMLVLGGTMLFAQEPSPAAAPAAEPAKEVKTGGWQEVFPDGLIDAEGNPVEVNQLEGKIVGLYFSAHWCPPCRAFSPKLVEYRDGHAADFEVVFVSSDKSPEAQLEYMKEVKMGWPAVKHGSETAQKLKEKYEIVGIPTLVILGPNGETISKSGRGEVSDSPDTCLENWKAAAKK